MIETRKVPPTQLADLAERIHRRWGQRPYTFWLDSGCDPERLGRYSFIGTDPQVILRCDSRGVKVRFVDRIEEWPGDPFEQLTPLVERLRASGTPAKGVPFTGGLVGFLSYDLGMQLLGVPSRHRGGLGLPLAFFGLYGAVVCIDHLENQLHLIAPATELCGGPEQAAKRLAWLAQEVDYALSAVHTCPELDVAGVHWRESEVLGGLESEYNRASYIKAVEQVQQEIAAGRVDQVNLAQHFMLPTELSGPDLFYRMRRVSPAPFAAALSIDGSWVLSSSPERFLKIEGRRVETRPIKGTRPRHADPLVDEAQRRDLLSHPKDRAEHQMIVELEKRELAALCVPGTVTVSELMRIEEYRTVYQMVSTLTGTLRPEHGPLDAVRMLFPCASITGSPKVESMRLIDELEPVGRGLYTGAIGYIGLGGTCDFNVAIRTLVLTGGVAHFHVGGAVVSGSNPEAEYEETLDKAEGIVRALLAKELTRSG